MTAAWEWRGFCPAGNELSLAERAAEFGAALGLPVPVAVAMETDTYLVLHGMRNNLKLRRGALEVKRFVTRQRRGYSLWEDKVIWTFPLTAEQGALLWTLLPPGCGPAPEATVASLEDLVTLLRAHDDSLAFVPLKKQRIRFDNGAARLELATLETPAGERWFTGCVDGYHLPAVRTLVRQSHVAAGMRVMDYVDFLGKVVWPVPNPAGEVVGLDAQ